ncbi:uncharacterized protein CXorf49 homolog [Molossus molossus]|uniref:uncharacterized protein CXorf49 homolog n=1 Tax=Molossus molossus TaxID=27622 RepID=UPI001746F3DF|nr:uncharacterized protein CXorf49 homolog [Molossus molossus]
MHGVFKRPTSPNLPPSDLEPSDISSNKFPETQLMSVSIVFKEEGQFKSSSFKNSGDTSRQDIFGGPVASLSTVPPTLAATTQREFAGELDISSPNKSSAKKMSCLISKKKADRSSHMPQATPREKELQEKKCPAGCVSKVVLGRKSQAYISGGPLAPTTFPPISGRAEIGIAEKCSLVPSGNKQSKHNSRKNPVLSRMRESELVGLEDTNPNKEPAPKGQLPAYRPGPFCLSMYVGRYSSGDPKIKSFPAPGHSALDHGPGKSQAQ